VFVGKWIVIDYKYKYNCVFELCLDWQTKAAVATVVKALFHQWQCNLYTECPWSYYAASCISFSWLYAIHKIYMQGSTFIKLSSHSPDLSTNIYISKPTSLWYSWL